MLSIAGVLIAFSLIIWLLSKKVNLGHAMFLGSIIVAITSKLSIQKTIKVFIRGISSEETLELIIIVTLIGVLAQLMEKTDLLTEMIESYSYIFNQKLIAVFIPSVIGALPIPGGAIMSAPLVKSIGDDMGLNDRKKMAINFLYRHIWGFVFPMIPGLILAAQLTSVNVFTLIKLQFPISVVMGLVGYYSLFKDNKFEKQKKEPKSIIRICYQLFITTLPLLVTFTVPLLFDVSLIIGLVIGSLTVIGLKYNKFRWSLLLESFDYKLTISVVGIMVFKEFINSGPDLKLLTDLLLGLGMPTIALVTIIPALVGYVTGSITAGVGISFPLLLPVINQGPILIMIMYSAVFFGYFVSPVHFCLILTNDYFGTKIKQVYYDLFWPTVTGIATLFLLVIIH
ncbi:DUF401 family protein [Sporohalobacter salinus]|uniref:DUF401 family protein n=1 Tax=Sporohalobacter salinus TaxID=1494606 RepID=UPI00195FA2EA|nr:DUF401 family protein [Sporohalobacter salinus]MBM7623351.1 integral membrane protein (TIGR00529 family) [Sporohalobacter salinus]